MWKVENVPDGPGGPARVQVPTVPPGFLLLVAITCEGWDGVGDERAVQEGGDLCVPVADSC